MRTNKIELFKKRVKCVKDEYFYLCKCAPVLFMLDKKWKKWGNSSQNASLTKKIKLKMSNCNYMRVEKRTTSPLGQVFGYCVGKSNNTLLGSAKINAANSPNPLIMGQFWRIGRRAYLGRPFKVCDWDWIFL